MMCEDSRDYTEQRGWEIKYRFRLSINGELSKLFSVIRIEFILVCHL